MPTKLLTHKQTRDALALVLPRCSVETLCVVSCVSKAWLEAASNPRLWRSPRFSTTRASVITDAVLASVIKKAAGCLKVLDISIRSEHRMCPPDHRRRSVSDFSGITAAGLISALQMNLKLAQTGSTPRLGRLKSLIVRGLACSDIDTYFQLALLCDHISPSSYDPCTYIKSDGTDLGSEDSLTECCRLCFHSEDCDRDCVFISCLSCSKACGDVADICSRCCRKCGEKVDYDDQWSDNDPCEECGFSYCDGTCGSMYTCGEYTQGGCGGHFCEYCRPLQLCIGGL